MKNEHVKDTAQDVAEDVTQDVAEDVLGAAEDERGRFVCGSFLPPRGRLRPPAAAMRSVSDENGNCAAGEAMQRKRAEIRERAKTGIQP